VRRSVEIMKASGFRASGEKGKIVTFVSSPYLRLKFFNSRENEYFVLVVREQKVYFCVFVPNIENEFFQQIVRDILSLLVGNEHVNFSDISDLTMSLDPATLPSKRSINVSIDIDTDDVPFWTNEEFAERIVAEEDGTEFESNRTANRVLFLQSYQRNVYYINDNLLVLAYNEFGGDPWEDYKDDLRYVSMIVENFSNDMNYLNIMIDEWEQNYHVDLLVRSVDLCRADDPGGQFQEF